MNKPSAEQFAAAPLFLPYAPRMERDWMDYSANEVVVEGFNLVRTDLPKGFSFALEGVHIIEMKANVVEGEAAWSGFLFDGTPRVVLGTDSTLAAEEIAFMIHQMVKNRPDSLVFHMEQAGVVLGQDPIQARYEDGIEIRFGDADDLDEDDEEGYGEMVEAEERFGQPVRIVRSGFRAWVEGEETHRAWGEVRDGFARAGEDSAPLCPASYPMLNQINAIEALDGRDGENAARHRVDLASLRTLLGDPSRIMDIGLRRDVHTFDLVGSDVRDAVVPQAAIEAFHQAREARFTELLGPVVEGEEIAPEAYEAARLAVAEIPDPTAPALNRVAERPIGEVMREATGFSAGAFLEIRDMPTYMREQIRGVGREMMAPHIGDVPMERIVCGRPSGNDPEAYAAFMHFFSEGELVKAVEPMSHPSMPGYQTSAGEVRRRDGWDALVFSDAFGTYAYAWPTQELAPEVEPEEEMGFRP